MAEVVLDKNSIPQNLNNLDLPLSQLGYNISQKRVTGTYGVYGNWGASGTAIPALGTQTPIDVSGKGKLSQVRFQAKYNLLLCRIFLDQTYAIYSDADSDANSIWSYAGALGTYGLIQLTHYDTGNNKYGIIYRTHELNDGIWGTSLKIVLTNPDAVNPHEAYVQINYLTTTSREFRLKGSVAPDARLMRQEIANRLGIEPGDLTVILAHQWDEALKKNVRELSVLHHPRGNASIADAIKAEIARQEGGIRASLIQEEELEEEL